MSKFSSLEEVPDLVPSCLLIPEARADMRVPQLDVASDSSTTPLEVGHFLYDASGWIYVYRQRLEIHALLGEGAEDFLNGSWMNHTGRAVVRAALDPDRTAPIDMYEVYKHERDTTASYPSRNEEDFYKHFVEIWGVYER